MLALRIAIFAALVPWRFRRPLRQLEAQLESRIEPSRMAQQPNAGVTLYYFLRRVGVDVSLVFGVAPEATGAVGHCWLVKDGEPYLESVDPREHFISMYSFNAHQTSAGSSGAERSRE